MPAVIWKRDIDNPILPIVPGTWRHSRVANCSLLIHGDTAYLYYPDHFGLARSRDLLHWQKHPEPVFLRGSAREWDDGGIWVGDVARVGDTCYLWYEGRSGGTDRNREYAPGGFSQIGLATLAMGDFTRLTRDFDRM